MLKYMLSVVTVLMWEIVRGVVRRCNHVAKLKIAKLKIVKLFSSVCLLVIHKNLRSRKVTVSVAVVSNFSKSFQLNHTCTFVAFFQHYYTCGLSKLDTACLLAN